MDLLGQHQVSFDAIRTLAIECHALDIAAYHLLVDSTQMDTTGKVRSLYEELITTKLLTLAIAIRTKFYQGVDHAGTRPYMAHCGFLFEEEIAREFSLKDACDKIIHADSVMRIMEGKVEKPTTSFRGARSAKRWELSISVSLFAEAILNWCCDAEQA